MRGVGFAVAALMALAATPAFAEPPSKEIVGPAQLCFMYSRFRLEAGERVTDLRLGFHLMSLQIDGPAGHYTISECNHCSSPRPLGPRVLQTETMTVRRRGAASYGAFGEADFAPGETRLLVMMSGPAMATRAGARGVYRRLEIGDPAKAACDQLFGYGFAFED